MQLNHNSNLGGGSFFKRNVRACCNAVTSYMTADVFTFGKSNYVCQHQVIFNLGIVFFIIIESVYPSLMCGSVTLMKPTTTCLISGFTSLAVTQ